MKALNNYNFDAVKLAEYAGKVKNGAVIRRLGYLCDKMNIEITLLPIKSNAYPSLDQTIPKIGKDNWKWRLIVNIDIPEPGALE